MLRQRSNNSKDKKTSGDIEQRLIEVCKSTKTTFKIYNIQFKGANQGPPLS